MSNSVLKLENVTMQFGGVVAVDDLSMEVREGEIVALIGPNGAGKTTAFNVVTGVYAPTNGCLYLDGKPYLREHPTGRSKREYLGSDAEKFADKPALRKTPDQITKMGLARTFQNIRLFGILTVFENVLIAKHMHAKGGFFAAALHLNCKEEARMRREAMELLEIVGLKELKDETASNLPYGQQRKLEIARALATDPKVLLCDEATSALDPNTTHAILQLIQKINRELGITVVIITHQMSVVEEVCNRVAILDNGTVVEEGEVQAIFSHPTSTAARRLVYPAGAPQAEVLPGHKLVRVAFGGTQTTDKPLVASLAIECGALVSIMAADTRIVNGQTLGSMLLALPDDDKAAAALEYIRNYPGITFEEVNG